MSKYTVVENAGYVGECDVKSFPTWRAAHTYLHDTYGEDEISSLHVEIAFDGPGGRTYEI